MDTPSQIRGHLQQYYSDIVKSAGFSPSISADGDVAFAYESYRATIKIGDDPLFFWIIVPSFWHGLNDIDFSSVIDAATAANMETKLAKVVLWDSPSDFVNCISTELLLTDYRQAAHCLETCLQAIQNANESFISHLKNK